MSWIEHHENSERLASQAQVAAQEGRRDEAQALYARAAGAEESAIADLDRPKLRTLGISAVSAASLHYKANRFECAEAVAARWLVFEALPAFAKDQLRLLLHACRNRGPGGEFSEVVPPSDYRRTFLKLTRNLAPDGKTCSRLDIHSPADPQAVSLDSDVRRNLGRIIRKTGQGKETPAAQRESLHGTLRALHLDQDWIELTVEDEHLRITSVGEEVDDVLGPLVNKPVIVYVSVVAEKRKFLDIEPDSQTPGTDAVGWKSG